MLHKTHRLLATHDFQQVYRRGRSTRGTFVNVRTAPNRQDVTRIGIVVSNKVSKRATDRNRIKRRLREALRGVTTDLRSGCDIVVSASNAASGTSYARLRADLRAVLKRAKLLTP